VNFLRRFGRFFGISSESGAAAPDLAPPTTLEDEARRIAAAWAAEHQKRWTLPASASLSDETGRRLWLIQSNAQGKGYSLVITIDNATGHVIAHHEYPR
jgi:hypothetical protein